MTADSNDLGRGVFSTVRLGHHKESKDQFAIKIINKLEMEEFDKQCLLSEIDVLSQLNHDHIIRLYDVFDATDHVYMILEMVHGGELLDRLIAKTLYTEREARDVCKFVMEAIRYCHDHKIAHRDLKAENLLLKSPTDDTTVQIADFGFAKHCPNDTALKTQCGSAQHVAPEILKNIPYGTKVDMWALGVIHYTLIGGRPPFYAENNQQTFQKILKADFTFPDELWGHVSDDCKEMIRGLLTIDPTERWSAERVLDCQWMRDDADELERTSLHVNQAELRAFNAKQKLKSAVYALIGLHRLQYNGELPAISEELEEEETKEEPEQEEAKETPEQEPTVEEPAQAPPAKEEEKEMPCVVTRDVYSAFTVEECQAEPPRKDYFALAQITRDFCVKVLKKKYGDNFDSVEVTLRKSLYNAAKPDESYNVYVEWDVTAHFQPSSADQLPTRRELCASIVMSNLETYILEHVRPLEETAFAKVTNVTFGHFAC